MHGQGPDAYWPARSDSESIGHGKSIGHGIGAEGLGPRPLFLDVADIFGPAVFSLGPAVSIFGPAVSILVAPTSITVAPTLFCSERI